MNHPRWSALRGRMSLTLLMLAGMIFGCSFASAQEGLGPFMPNNGGVMTTVWANAYGPDAESWIRFAKVGTNTFDIYYSSSRGTVAVRRVRVADRATARTIVLGYSPKMPLIIENTTVLGTSAAVLEELRTTGQANAALAYNDSLATMQGSFTLVDRNVKMPISVAGRLVRVPVVRASGSFRDGRKSAKGDFYFLNNRNNPVLLQYEIYFSGEKTPRAERVVRVDAGARERAAMEQALAALRDYTTYGIHFDFDKASIRNSSSGLLDEIATALANNPLWTLRITGHTDSIGGASYNNKLSQKRAESVKAALVKRGIAASRLTTAGAGAAVPIASNKSLQGRALNRRVVLTRTDR